MLNFKAGGATWWSFEAWQLVLAAWVTGLILPEVMGKEPARPKEPPTFTRDVAPILQKKCLYCHRRHHVGPFALGTYEQASKRAEDIASVVADRSMPPWKPKAGVGPKLQHDQSLSAEEIATLEAWAEAGAPKGDPSHMPPMPEYAEGWKLGEPDLILVPDEDFAIPASGEDTYRCFVIPTNLARDVFISAIDVRPGNLKVVHHINVFLETSGAARKRDQAEPGPGYTSFAGPGIDDYEELTFWTAGNVPTRLPSGIGQRMPRQSDVILQVHYHPTGKPEVDRTSIGVYFSREPIKQALHWNTASNSEFQLPAGKSRIEVKASWFVPVDVDALAVSPHMHLLGTDMRIWVAYANGRKQDMIHIPAWDPSWQGTYYFQKPIALPRGSVVHVLAHFDNSDHPRNPNHPPIRVKYGYGAFDEMCEGFIAVVKRGQDLTVPRATDDLADTFKKQRIRNKMKQMSKKSR